MSYVQRVLQPDETVIHQSKLHALIFLPALFLLVIALALLVGEALRIFRGTVGELAKEEWGRGRAADLRRFAVDVLERHLERRLVSAGALGRG